MCSPALNSENKTSRGIAGQPWEPMDGQWVVARTDAMIETSPVDIYAILEAPSLHVRGFEIVTGENIIVRRPKTSSGTASGARGPGRAV